MNKVQSTTENEITWTRMNLKEVVSELPCPLTQSILISTLKAMFIEEYKKMGYNLPEDIDLVRIFYGRPYFNTNIFLKITSDFGSDTKIIKMMIGGFQPDLIEGLKLSTYKKIKTLTPIYVKTLPLHNNINKISEENFSIIREQFETNSNKDLIGLSDIELLNYGKFLNKLFLNKDLTLIVSGGASYYYDLLQKFLKTIFVEEEKPDNIINELVTGEGDIISANQTLALVRLAGEGKNSDTVYEAMEKNIESCYIKLEGTRFRQMVDEFLQEFGHRCSYETDVEIPRYAENPTLILKIIKTYIDAGITDPTEITVRQKKVREAAEEKVKERIKEGNFSYFKMKLFKSNLEKCRSFMALREKNRYHCCAMIAALSRKLYLELGRRFTEKDILEQQNDIFFLNISEIYNILNGEKKDFRNIVVDRKIERENNSKLTVPDIITGDVLHPIIIETVKETKKVFSGRGASSGIVRGIARIIRSTEEFKKFKSGDILVTPATDPNWSVLFPIANAVVTEMGGLLSHASIVAREYGIPCVVNVQGIIAALEDGDLIEVDGTSGIVKILIDDLMK